MTGFAATLAPDVKEFPIALAARTGLTIDGTPTARPPVTEFGPTERPNRLKSLIEFAERVGVPETHIFRYDTSSIITKNSGCSVAGARYTLSGANLNYYSCGSPAANDFCAPAASTTVPIDSLFNAIFQRPKRPQFLVRAPYGMRGEDLIVRYFTDTTCVVRDLADEPWPMLIFDPGVPNANAGSRLLEPSPTISLAPPRLGELKSRSVARKLADFLNVTLKDLGAMTKIGRTTFSSWHTKNPRAATLLDLYRLDSLISALRSALGDERTKIWLHAGTPSPFSLLAANQLSAVETLATSLIFKPVAPSPSLSLSDYDLADLPIAKPYGGPVRAAKRAIRGRLTLDA